MRFSERVKEPLRKIEFLNLGKTTRQFFARSALRNPYEANRSSKTDKPFIFVHVPKTAGQSMCVALGVYGGHYPLSRYFSIDQTRFEASYKCAIVRHPVDRFQSAFFHLKRSSYISASDDGRWAGSNLSRFRTIEDFVEELQTPRKRRRFMSFKHFRPQLDWICLPGSRTPAVDFLGRFENLQPDVRIIQEALEIGGELIHKNAGESDKLPLSDVMRKAVFEIYREDAEVLGYKL